MTNYTKCQACGQVRVLFQVIDGVKTRTCFSCFRQQYWKPDLARTKKASLVVCLVLLLVAGPALAEQIMLDGQEFRAHVAHDQRVQQERDALKTDRDNLEKQVGLYRQNEQHYKAVVKEQKALQQKTDEKSSAQESLLATYEEQRVQIVAQQKELADEVRRVKQEKDTLTWKQRGEGFAAGLAVVGAVAAYVLRGGR